MTQHAPRPESPPRAVSALLAAVRELTEDELGTAVVALALARDGMAGDPDVRRLGDVIGAACAMFAAEQSRRRRLLRHAQRQVLDDRVPESWWGDRRVVEDCRDDGVG